MRHAALVLIDDTRTRCANTITTIAGLGGSAFRHFGRYRLGRRGRMYAAE